MKNFPIKLCNNIFVPCIFRDWNWKNGESGTFSLFFWHEIYSNGNKELALFGQGDFTVDNEGIAIYKTPGNKGYILVSDQGARQLKVYDRVAKTNAAHPHPLLTTIKYSANQTDGIDVVSVPLNNDFKHGLLVAMSDDRTFHFYRWEDIAGKKLTSVNP